MSTRDNLLDAFEELLIDDGERSATLEAVAARAQVSKGGLLYHFKSKDALVEGLLERLVEHAQIDAEQMRTDPRGPSAYYVDTSVYAGSALDRSLMATARLIQETPRVRETMQDIHQRWFSIILQEVGERGAARAVMLIGDGLYYNAVLSGGTSAEDVAGTDPDDRAELLSVVARLTGRQG
ncbi:MAG TPA: helix-turn-helix domain-containing protein [Beutenbergiaceae bacterium]|nr:helix-turn-helix domain-containing protein [Beutenbergiaceae bacterium]